MLQLISKMEDGFAPPDTSIRILSKGDEQRGKKGEPAPEPERFYHTLDSWLDAFRIDL